MIKINENSYVTVEEADEYFETRLGADSWTEIDEQQKEKALITATKKIDRLPFIGYKKSPSQPLQFPRMYYNSCSACGLQIADISQQLKDAVYEEALTTLQFIENNSQEVYNGAVESSYQSLKLGDASITYGSKSSTSTSNSGLLSKNAGDLLQGLIKVGFDISNPVFYEVY